MSEQNLLWPDWPIFGLDDDVRPTLAAARAHGTTVALVTLFHSEGGSPRGVGAQMVVGDKILVGHVSGGCVEPDVANHCWQVISNGIPQRLIYGKGGPWDLPLPCGGRIELLIEPVIPDDKAVADLLSFTARREECVWISDGNARRCVLSADAALPILREAGVAGSSIYRRYEPKIRVIIVGSDPNALAIAGLAAKIGMEAVLVDRLGPASPPPLPGVVYSRDAPAQALATIGLDRWTAVAACTHDHELDHETLLTALSSPAMFVGALGSARRRPERLAALRASRLNELDIARLKSPIGLSIGARAPWEIALSTLAEIVALQRSADAERVRRVA